MPRVIIEKGLYKFNINKEDLCNKKVKTCSKKSSTRPNKNIHIMVHLELNINTCNRSIFILFFKYY